MPKYRKKPVVIEAFQLPPEGEDANEELINFLHRSNRGITSERNGSASISTLGGTMTANPRDYIVRDVKGEYYPCKPDIFEATYEPMNDLDIVFENLTDKEKEDIIKFAKSLKPPESKVVDLSVVCGSNIPMLFGDGDCEDDEWLPGYLSSISYGVDFPYHLFCGPAYKRCRFDTTRPVAWFGGECPLPDGVEFKAWLRHGGLISESVKWWRHRDSQTDIIAFQVLGLMEGWKYPWE